MNLIRHISIKALSIRGGFALVCLFVCLFVAQKLKAEELDEPEPDNTALNVTPQRCVTLREGQPCFVRLRFKWSSSEALGACLINSAGEEIKCWVSAKEGTVLLPQNLINTTEYVLVKSDGEELQRTNVVVSWVYRQKRSKRRWRLF